MHYLDWIVTVINILFLKDCITITQPSSCLHIGFLLLRLTLHSPYYSPHIICRHKMFDYALYGQKIAIKQKYLYCFVAVKRSSALPLE